MKIKILGSGTSIPLAHRKAPAYLIQQEKTSLLIDCGSGTMNSLQQTGLALNQLTGILLTHFHLDDLLPIEFYPSVDYLNL